MVIFLHGDDTYRSRAKLRELEEKFRRDIDPSGANLVRMDGATASASAMWGAIAAQSFLVRKRMVVIEDLGVQKSKGAREEVVAFLDRIPDDAIVVFWESHSRQPTADSRKQRSSTRTKSRTVKKKPATASGDPLFPLLLKGKYVEEFAPLAGAALDRWVRDRAESLGATIANDALRLLVAEVGANLWRMSGEIEKLALAASTPSRSPSSMEGEKGDSFPTSQREWSSPSQQRGSERGYARRRVGGRGGVGTITSDLVRTLVAETPTDDMFAFVDAIGCGDGAGALRNLRALEATGTDPGAIVGMLSRQVRMLVTAADLLARGTPAAQLAPAMGIYPFVARKIEGQVQRTSLARLRALYPRLLELDRKLKSSRVPWEALIDCFCVDATAA